MDKPHDIMHFIKSMHCVIQDTHGQNMLYHAFEQPSEMQNIGNHVISCVS